MPSKREGFGNTVIESSACEVPVVGSDIFGLQSSLIHELNGLTFKVNNVDDLTKKLSMLLEDENLCKKLGCYLNESKIHSKTREKIKSIS